MERNNQLGEDNSVVLSNYPLLNIIFHLKSKELYEKIEELLESYISIEVLEFDEDSKYDNVIRMNNPLFQSLTNLNDKNQGTMEENYHE